METPTELDALHAADLAASVRPRIRAQQADLQARLGALEAACRAGDADALAARSRLRALRATLARLSGRDVLAVYAQVLLDAARGRPVSLGPVHALDRRYGYPPTRDPVVTAARALRVADGRAILPAEEWLARVLALALPEALRYQIGRVTDVTDGAPVGVQLAPLLIWVGGPIGLRMTDDPITPPRNALRLLQRLGLRGHLVLERLDGAPVTEPDRVAVQRAIADIDDLEARADRAVGGPGRRGE